MAIERITTIIELYRTNVIIELHLPKIASAELLKLDTSADAIVFKYLGTHTIVSRPAT